MAIFLSRIMIDDEKRLDAKVEVIDGCIVNIESRDGVKLRLLVYEVWQIAKYVADEVERWNKEHEDEDPEPVLDDEPPFTLFSSD